MLKHLLVVAVVAVTFRITINTLDWFGFFQRVYNHSPGDCRKLTGLEFGSEDIQVLPNGVAFISSGLRLRHTDVYNSRPGRIFLFDFNQPDLAPQQLTINAAADVAKDFELVSPHGLSVWTDPNTGEVDVYVTSHIPVETVDKFRFDSATKTLTLVKHIAADPNIHSLNDLVVVGDNQFYYTNFFQTAEWFEFPLGLRWGSIGFYDGSGGDDGSSSSRLVETGLCGPNGIDVSPDRRLLYVSVYCDLVIRVYTRDESNNALTFSHSIEISTKADNLNVDAPTGDLWFASHPATYRILWHLDDPKVPSPSQVIRMQMSADGRAESMEEILSDDGKRFSASSVAVVYGQQLLIGSVTGPPLYCRLQ